MRYKRLVILITIILAVPLYNHGIDNPGMWENIRMWLPSKQRMTVGAKILVVLGMAAVAWNFKNLANKGYSYFVKSRLREYFRGPAERQEDIIDKTIWSIRGEITSAKKSINELSPCNAQSHDQIKKNIDELNIEINKKIGALSELCVQLTKQNKCTQLQLSEIKKLGREFYFFVVIVNKILDCTRLFATSENSGKKFAASLDQNLLDAKLLELIEELKQLMPPGITLSATLAKDALLKHLGDNIHLVNHAINTAPEFIQKQCTTIWNIYIENANEMNRLIETQLLILNNYTEALEKLNKLKFLLQRKKELFMIETHAHLA